MALPGARCAQEGAGAVPTRLTGRPCASLLKEASRFGATCFSTQPAVRGSSRKTVRVMTEASRQSALDEVVRSLTELLPTLKDNGSIVDALSTSCFQGLNPLDVMHKLIKTGVVPHSQAWLALEAHRIRSRSSHGPTDSTSSVGAFDSLRIPRPSPLEQSARVVPSSPAIGPAAENETQSLRPASRQRHGRRSRHRHGRTPRSAGLRMADHALQKPCSWDSIDALYCRKEEMSSSGSTEGGAFSSEAMNL